MNVKHSKALFIFVGLIGFIVCGFYLNILEERSMNSRLKNVFAEVDNICFGRFVISVPKRAKMIWGDAAVPLTVWVEDGRVEELAVRVLEVESQLKSEIKFPRSKGLSLYFETLDGSVSGMRNIVSQQDAGSDGMLRINSFFPMGKSLVGMEARPLAESKDKALEALNGMAMRLRPRAELEAPAESGVCLEHAFLVDDPSVAPKDINEHIQVGFRLDELPDVHLSIHVAPYGEMKWSLDHQLQVSQERARKAGEPDPFGELKIFRRAKRQIHDWHTGFEILTRTPDEAGVHAYHDFWMKFTGAPDDPFKPFADIRMQTGVGESSAGAVKPSLTDEEAIALWEKLTGSIRVRPTSSIKTSQAPKRKFPLGELHVTGHRCPQTGWWECNDDLNLAQPSGLWLEQGQLMPKALVWVQPSLWDKLKGTRPVGWTPAVWRLAGYEKPQ